MEAVGVEAIVEGMMSFSSDMDKIQGKIDDLGVSGTVLGSVFEGVGNILGSFGREVLNVAEVALGVLLRDAIQGIISLIGEMVEKTIEAGSEFQTLTLRLNGFNMDALIKSGADYNTAATEAVRLTQEQLSWLQKLAAATPYDNADISNIYTLARAYGFTDDTARQLTRDTGNFAAAMGLSSEHMERIIVNLGQMKSRGKITSTELRDLARGAFLPLDDVLGRVAKSMGVTTAKLQEMISAKGAGVPFEEFQKAFQQMIAEEPRFVGASERMARTFKAASDNVMDLATSFGGLNIVTPILDVLGGKIADFMDQFLKSSPAGQELTNLGQRLRGAAVEIGQALSEIVAKVLGLLPSSDNLAESLVGGLEQGADWLMANKDVIVANIQGVVEKVKEGIAWFARLFAPPVENSTNKGIVAMLYDLGEQLFKVDPRDEVTNFERLQTVLGEIGKTVEEIVLGALGALGTNIPDVDFSVRGFINALQDLSKWLKENKFWLEVLLVMIGTFLILQLITGLFWSFVGALIGTVAAVVTTMAALGAMTVIIGTVIGIIGALDFILKVLQVTFSFVFTFMMELMINLARNFVEKFNEIRNAIANRDWIGLGRAVIDGIINGINIGASDLIGAVVRAAMSAFEAAKAALGIHSPSTLFAGIGENMMVGMAEGIAGSADLAVNAMRGVVAAVSAPAMNLPAVTASYSQAAPSSVSSNYQTNTTNNLIINSQAQTEQVAASFAMMSSLAGN